MDDLGLSMVSLQAKPFWKRLSLDANVAGWAIWTMHERQNLGKWCFKCYLSPKLSSPNCSALKLDVRTYLICMQRKSRSWSTSNGTSALSTCHGMMSIQNHRASSEHQDAHHLLQSTNIEYETKVIIWRTKDIQAYFLVADLISALRK